MLLRTLHRSFARRLLPLFAMGIVPPIALAAWFAVQYRDRLPPPLSSCCQVSLIFDEYDLTAMALRGLNADRGRLAGRATSPDDAGIR
jgi:hypothetical protein